MRKFLVRAIPIFALTLFILIMLSENVLKKPITKNDDVSESIELLMDNIKENQWEHANSNANKLSHAWDKVVKRIQFSTEKNEMDDMYISIARIRGAVQAKDKNKAIIELEEAYEHWADIGR